MPGKMTDARKTRWKRVARRVELALVVPALLLVYVGLYLLYQFAFGPLTIYDRPMGLLFAPLIQYEMSHLPGADQFYAVSEWSCRMGEEVGSWEPTPVEQSAAGR
jgi:hypothetical protein